MKAFVLPPNAFLWSGLAGVVLLFVAPLLGVWILAGSFLALFLLAIPAVAAALATTLDRHPPLPPTGELPPAEAVVVLSAGLVDHAREHGGPDVGALALERLRWGARLHRRSGCPVLITGYSAPLMARALVEDFGLVECRVEKQSRDTWENASESARILKDEGLDRIYLVTHFWHLPRALAAFKAEGLEVVPAPMGFAGRDSSGWMPDPEALELSGRVVHEWVGALWYRCRQGWR